MTPKAKQIILPLIILALAIVIMAALIVTKKKPEQKESPNNTTFVTVETVELTPLTLTVKSQGLVQPKYQTRLLAQASGEIIEVADAFVRGGLVKRGQLLAQIDPFNYQVRLQQANATLASARAQFILERAQGQVAEAEWAKITSAKPSELGLRKPQQEQALAAVKAAEAGVRQATKDLQRTKIIAPFDALISARNVSPGTFVNMGTDIGSVMDTESAEIRLPVSGNDLRFLDNHGQQAQVTLSATVGGENAQWQATIVRDEGVVDDSSRMVYLVARINDPYNQQQREGVSRLPFGTYISASIAGRHLNAAASVPRQLLRDNRIALLIDHKLRFAEVDVIRHEGAQSIITNGLTNGDQLITSSLEYPVAGMALSTELDAPEEEQPLVTAEPNPNAATVDKSKAQATTDTES